MSTHKTFVFFLSPPLSQTHTRTYTHAHTHTPHRYAALPQRKIINIQAINRCIKPFKYGFQPFLPGRPPAPPRLKRDTYQLCDRSRDHCSIDPEGGEQGWEEGRRVGGGGG